MTIPVMSYLIASLAFAGVFFVLAARLRTPGEQTPEHQGFISLVGGVMWPLVLVGLVQLGAIALFRKYLSARQPAVATHGMPKSSSPAPAWMYSHA